MFLSRLTVEESAVAFANARAHDTYGHHQQIWGFWPDDPDAKRDFLYRFDLRQEGPTFYAVSSRRPNAALPGWKIESREYEPRLEAGARLRFSLRANPTKRVAEPGQRADGKRHDVVMARKWEARNRGEAIDGQSIVQEAGFEWLAKQGARHGFRVEPSEVRVEGYRPHRFRREKDGRDMTVTGIDYEGVLHVSDPAQFDQALAKGIGPAKGFGFGLLLVRRA